MLKRAPTVASTAAPGTLAYVGFRRRFMAFLIDSLFASILLYPLTWLFTSPALSMGVDLTNAQQVNQMISGMLTHLSIQTVLVGGVFVALWMRWGSSPGKMLLQCHIVDAHTGGPATTRQLVIRYIGYYLSLLPLGLGFFWIGLAPRKQGWHDMLANTLVVRTDPK
ncbi:MAG: RDD family protein [Pseudomonadales bacterium]|nr:RDD family protein [Pseudomonadales bacterium]MDP4639503.1 RDD family protein [Pseudomonadales bacterium]MDP4764876.1 RDD family protein [Pseudomonadales bacterium]MDP4876292.1 RDD family protein [Pseudomonadales bacterium]MDP4910264.1 RDD family protein [Pseudomonadales bacterium]